MKKLLILALATGLVAGSLAVGAEAKKKKKLVSKAVNYYLRSADCTADVFSLSISDGEDSGNCGSFDNGPSQEVFKAAGEEYLEQVWVAADGIPFKLDATKALTGTIYMGSWSGASAGSATLDVVINGNSGGESVEIGKASTTYTVTPETNYHEVTFEIDVADDLNKKSFTTLELHTVSRGTAPLHGYYGLETEVSYFTMPTLAKK